MRKMRQILNWRETESFDSLSSIVESGETDGFSIPFLYNFYYSYDWEWLNSFNLIIINPKSLIFRVVFLSLSLSEYFKEWFSVSSTDPSFHSNEVPFLSITSIFRIFISLNVKGKLFGEQKEVQKPPS